MKNNQEELLKHLAASLKDAKDIGGAILLVGAGISVSAGIPPAFKLMKIAIENFPNYFTEEEQRLAQKDLNQLQYNDIMTKLPNVKRKELFKWFIEGNEEKRIEKAKLNFAHIAIAELLKQGYFSRILTVNFDPLLIHACYMVGMYPLPAIYDLGSVERVNPELFNDPCIIYLNGQHVGQVQRNTTNQLTKHDPILQKVVHSTGCTKAWVVAGYSGENDPLMHALNELRPYNNWLYWLEYRNQVIQKESHHFLENDEECKVIYGCDADETFINITNLLRCSLNFLENPQELQQCYLDEIKFDTHKLLGDSYKKFIRECIEQLNSINFENKLIDYKAFQNLTYIIIDHSNKEYSYRFKEYSKPSLYRTIIQERLDNLVKLKEELEKAKKIQPNNFWVLIMLSHVYLTNYGIKKRENILDTSSKKLLCDAEDNLTQLEKTDEYTNNHNNLVSRVLFNRACLESLKDNTELCLELLEKALKQNQQDAERYFIRRDLEIDLDFKNLLELPKFRQLCDQYF